jgi:hypothetical protein
MSDKKTELLQNFALAAGELTTEALNGLIPEKRQALGEALASGAAHVRLIVVLSPLIVIGSLHSTTDRSIPPQVLFRIDGDGLPKNEDFN